MISILGDLSDGEEVLEWILNLVEGADIEEVTDDMLEKMILKEEKLSVLFYEENVEESNVVLNLLEEIDDDLDELDVLLVKINEATVASDFGIEQRPCLVIFEKGMFINHVGTIHWYSQCVPQNKNPEVLDKEKFHFFESLTP